MRTKKVLSTFYFAGIVLFVVSGAYLWICFDLVSTEVFGLGRIISQEPYLILGALVAAQFFALASVFMRRKARAIEHPLTAALYYRVFYYLCPFVGALAGAIAVLGSGFNTNGLTIVAAGTVLTTAIVWVMIDPVITLIELLGPKSRRLRHVRAVKVKEKRLRKNAHKQRLLEEARSQSSSILSNWEDVLSPYAQELADLVIGAEEPETHRRARAIDIALHASRLGGRRCMQHLYHMARRECRERTEDDWIVHNISVWWDGIGGWRNEGTLSRTH